MIEHCSAKNIHRFANCVERGALVTMFGKNVLSRLQNLFDAVGDQKAASKLAKLDPVFVVATLIGVNGFYFSGFPTLMGERLSYDPYEPERLEQLKSSIRLLVKLLIKSAS